jgi:hypothetical protein
MPLIDNRCNGYTFIAMCVVRTCSPPVDHGLVGIQSFCRKKRNISAGVSNAQIAGADGAGQEASTQGGVGDEAYSGLLRGRVDVLVRISAPDGPLALHGGDRVRGAGFPQFLASDLRQAEAREGCAGVPASDEPLEGQSGRSGADRGPRTACAAPRIPILGDPVPPAGIGGPGTGCGPGGPSRSKMSRTRRTPLRQNLTPPTSTTSATVGCTLA